MISHGIALLALASRHDLGRSLSRRFNAFFLRGYMHARREARGKFRAMPHDLDDLHADIALLREETIRIVNLERAARFGRDYHAWQHDRDRNPTDHPRRRAVSRRSTGVPLST